jgi:hypothetical protein
MLPTSSTLFAGLVENFAMQRSGSEQSGPPRDVAPTTAHRSARSSAERQYVPQESTTMGIRYFAFPVSADVAETAAASPRDYFRSLSRYAGDPETPEPLEPCLDLDKAWSYLQRILRAPGSEPWDEGGRPAYELVRGHVENTDAGWRSFVRVLTASQVRAIAVDLSAVDECEVMTRLAGRVPHSSEDSERFEHDVEYTLEYLQRAIEFVRDLSQRGLGLAYSIG